MGESKEFTLQEVAEHNTKKDLYMVIHDKVYNVSSFLSEHPYVAFSSLFYLFPILLSEDILCYGNGYLTSTVTPQGR